jgi:hypothetical protein
MNFTMVMIVCFTVEVCTAMFDDTRFYGYDACYESSRSAVSYMQEMYPDSAGEVHCLTDEELAVYREFIDQGGKPQLKNPEPAELPKTEA